MASRALTNFARGAAVVALLSALGYAWWVDRQMSDQPAPSRAATPVEARAPAAHATDGTHAAPFEMFANAKVGDWYAWRTVNGGSLGDIRTTALAWITAERADSVTRTYRGKIDATGEERAGRPEDFPRAGLTIDRFTSNDIGGWTLSDITMTDEVHVVGGRSFQCKKIVFASSDPMFPRKRTRTELWISTDVRAGGLVAEHEVQQLDAMTFDITQELIGFGTATETIWGTRPAGW
jgi:hypothetical protein